MNSNVLFAEIDAKYLTRIARLEQRILQLEQQVQRLRIELERHDTPRLPMETPWSLEDKFWY